MKHVHDPGHLLFSRALRVAIVLPLAYLFTNYVLKMPEGALYAVFGTFVLLSFADFGGPTPDRARAYLVTGLATWSRSLSDGSCTQSHCGRCFDVHCGRGPHLLRTPARIRRDGDHGGAPAIRYRRDGWPDSTNCLSDSSDHRRGRRVLAGSGTAAVAVAQSFGAPATRCRHH